MPSAVWSGHLHFGLVVMPVRLLVVLHLEAKVKTTIPTSTGESEWEREHRLKR